MPEALGLRGGEVRIDVDGNDLGRRPAQQRGKSGRAADETTPDDADFNNLSLPDGPQRQPASVNEDGLDVDELLYAIGS